MTTLFENQPSNEAIFNMTVPLGEPCGCYDNRGCLESIYCSCECDCCLTQRKVDADLACGCCRIGRADNYVQLTNSLGEDEYKRVCGTCYTVYKWENGMEIPDDLNAGYEFIIDEGADDLHVCPPDCVCENLSAITENSECSF